MPRLTITYQLPDEQAEYDAARLGRAALEALRLKTIYQRVAARAVPVSPGRAALEALRLGTKYQRVAARAVQVRL